MMNIMMMMMMTIIIMINDNHNAGVWNKNKSAVLHPTGTQSGRSGAFWAHLAILFSSGILIHASGGKPYGNGDFQPSFK